MSHGRRLVQRVLIRDPLTDRPVWLEAGTVPDPAVAARIGNPLVWEPVEDPQPAAAPTTPVPVGEDAGSGPGPSSPTSAAPDYETLDRPQLLVLAADRDITHRANASATRLRQLLTDADTAKAPDQPQE